MSVTNIIKILLIMPYSILTSFEEIFKKTSSQIFTDRFKTSFLAQTSKHCCGNMFPISMFPCLSNSETFLQEQNLLPMKQKYSKTFWKEKLYLSICSPVFRMFLKRETLFSRSVMAKQCFGIYASVSNTLRFVQTSISQYMPMHLDT